MPTFSLICRSVQFFWRRKARIRLPSVLLLRVILVQLPLAGVRVLSP